MDNVTRNIVEAEREDRYPYNPTPPYPQLTMADLVHWSVPVHRDRIIRWAKWILQFLPMDSNLVDPDCITNALATVILVGFKDCVCDPLCPWARTMLYRDTYALYNREVEHLTADLCRSCIEIVEMARLGFSGMMMGGTSSDNFYGDYNIIPNSEWVLEKSSKT